MSVDWCYRKIYTIEELQSMDLSNLRTLCVKTVKHKNMENLLQLSNEDNQACVFLMRNHGIPAHLMIKAVDKCLLLSTQTDASYLARHRRLPEEVIRKCFSSKSKIIFFESLLRHRDCPDDILIAAAKNPKTTCDELMGAMRNSHAPKEIFKIIHERIPTFKGKWIIHDSYIRQALRNEILRNGRCPKDLKLQIMLEQ